jgi:predicted MPP superfamily phosphohydrolase
LIRVYKHCSVFLLFFFSLLYVTQEETYSQDTTTICILSDTQIPIFFESLHLARNNNLDARKLILQRVRDINPSAVFHLGDLVALPFLETEWAGIDEFVQELKLKNCHFYPIPGNHEYMIFPKKSISYFISRFSRASTTGYSVRIENIAVILLNSNYSYLSKKERVEQLIWYKNTMESLEADSSVQHIVLGCHHPPFTNSTIIAPSDYVQKYFLPDFFKSKKGKLFLSGHAHAFEHYNFDEKDFLVIGGGGGLQQPLHTGKTQRYPDLFQSSSDFRMFHFLTLKVYKNDLYVYLNIVKDDFTGFEVIPFLTYPGD